MTRTLSGVQTRDKSLRSKSTIITFSARSFSLLSNSSPANRSDSGNRRPPPRALDRPRFDLALTNLQEAFGRRADDLKRPQIEIARERGRIALPQPQVQRHGVGLGRDTAAAGRD